jgi:hypothetical protein
LSLKGFCEHSLKATSCHLIDEALMTCGSVFDKQNLKQVLNLLNKQKQFYPKLHSSNHLLVSELLKEYKASKSTQKLVKTVSLIQKYLLDDGVFEEESYEKLKSGSKFKYIHIGFKLVQMLMDQLGNVLKDAQVRESLLEIFLSDTFVPLFVKNAQM